LLPISGSARSLCLCAAGAVATALGHSHTAGVGESGHELGNGCFDSLAEQRALCATQPTRPDGAARVSRSIYRTAVTSRGKLRACVQLGTRWQPLSTPPTLWAWVGVGMAVGERELCLAMIPGRPRSLEKSDRAYVRLGGGRERARRAHAQSCSSRATACPSLVASLVACHCLIVCGRTTRALASATVCAPPTTTAAS